MKFLTQSLHKKIVALVAKVKWKQRAQIDDATRAAIHKMLAKDYYIIATRRGNYFTTFLISLGNFFMTFKWGQHSHVLMNLEDEVNSSEDFRLIEATMKAGTHYSTFEEVFTDVDSVALLRPKNITIREWTAALDSVKTYLGVPYDSLFDMRNAAEINCVELVWLAIQSIPEYRNKFPDVVNLFESYATLTPSMLVNSSDFEVYYSTRR